MRMLVKAFVLFFLILPQFLFAQTKNFTGTVVDDKGAADSGATVNVKGTKTSVLTNDQGIFVIAGSGNSPVLVITSVGFARQEVKASDGQKIALVATTATLNDVVVIGYGTQRRQDLNGSVSSVKASDIAAIPQTSIDQLLQGKAAGITITQNSGAPGSSTSVHIRGITSLSGSNEPLYVIDGVAISGDATNRSTSGRSAALSGNSGGESGASPLATLNPNDIESIDILKDASATAIYGSRASNGVIIITTKRGKAGTAHINYDGYYGIQQQGRFLDVLNLQQFAVLENKLADVYGIPRRSEFADSSLLGEGTDWQKEVFQTAAQQSHQVSVSGANNATDYYISGGYLTQGGTIIGNDFNRYSFRANINSKVKSWLKVGSQISGSRSAQNQSLSNNNGIVYTAVLSAPDQVVYNADGTYAGPQADQIGGQINPVAQALDITNTLTRNTLFGSLYADLNLSKDLTLRSEINGDFNFSNALVFLPTYQYGPRYVNPTNSLTERNDRSTFWSWKEYLTYSHVFAQKHSVTALLGHEVLKSVWNGTTGTAQNFLSNDIHTLNLGTASTATVDEYKGSEVLESGFARGIYTYNNTYSITATIRADKSSKFAEGHQTGYFPSFAASWRLSEEPFMASVKDVADNIKIRVGYGAVGNQAIPNYRYGAGLTSFATGLGTAFAIDKVANPNLTWESAVSTNIGLDFSLFKNRIDASVDYFDKKSEKFLYQAPLPAFLLGGVADYNGTGVIAPPYLNIGELSNKGVEFTINSKNIVSKDFTWNTNVIFSHYKNKVLSLANGIPFLPGSATISFLSLTLTRTQVGRPVGEFYGYKVKGLFRDKKQLEEAPIQFGQPVQNPRFNNGNGTWLGDIQYEDINADGKIDENDQTAIGNPNPKFTYSLTNNFSYKGIDLSIFLYGSYGSKIINALNYQVASVAGLYVNQLASVADFWTPENPDANTPAPRAGDNKNLINSDRFVENGSFLRIQNVNLGYNLPAKWISRLKLNRLKIYASGQNLFVFTPYKGLDPEIGAANQNVFLTNVDLGRYPIPRTITFGINAEF